MSDYIEYVFTLPDGSQRFEIIQRDEAMKQMTMFITMHGAVSAGPFMEQTEADEIAANVPDAALAAVRTMTEAREYVRGTAGTPAEIGYTVFDNMAEAIFDRAHAERRRRVAADMAALAKAEGRS